MNAGVEGEDASATRLELSELRSGTMRLREARLARAAYAHSKRAFGTVLPPLKAYAHSTAVLSGTIEMETALAGASSIPPRYQVLGNLRIALRVGCPF